LKLKFTRIAYYPLDSSVLDPVRLFSMFSSKFLSFTFILPISQRKAWQQMMPQK